VRTDTATVREHFASVHCRLIAADGAETRLEHRLRQSGSRWRVYDFIVDGVSFVNSYREHVDRIITATSYQEMVWRLQLKGLESGPVAWPDR
jgi:phospholipid transport system substrate-binding protein